MTNEYITQPGAIISPVVKTTHDTITVGIDPSTTSTGIAIYKNGYPIKTQNVKLPGNYNTEKLKAIICSVENIFEEYRPDIIVIEEPFMFSFRFSNAVSQLNQLYGALVSLGMDYTSVIYPIHNQTVKKIFNLKGRSHKEVKPQMFAKAVELTECNFNTQDEADAVLMVEAYKVITKNLK